MGRFDERHEPCANALAGELHEPHREFYGVVEYVCDGKPVIHPQSALGAMEYADIYVETPTTKMMLDEEIELWMQGVDEEDEAWRNTFSAAGWILIGAALTASAILIAFSLYCWRTF